MYTKEILQYLTWPLLILASWYAVRAGLYIFEKKFRKPDETSTGPGSND